MSHVIKMPERALLTIYRVHESPTRTGQPRFTIDAQRVDSDLFTRYVSLTTLDQWRASLCDQAMKVELPLVVTFRDDGYFDKTIVAIERPTPQGAA